MSTCIITGASRGIGRAVAIELSKRKEIQDFILIARDSVKLEETKKLMAPHNEIHICAVDVGDIDELSKIVNWAGESFGSIDYLLNIAGYADPHSLIDTTNENWETTYKVNVQAPFVLIRESVPYMKEKGGVILNVASTAGITPRPGWLAYSSSKAAIISMSETLTDELMEYGIKVYCISPGRCATDLRRALAPDEDQSKIMQPSHVAKVISNMIFENENCLDGQNIIVRKPVLR
ncbi:MAG: SDR family NAD(P)-dependent oxidoreductase [Fusobacteria bacterium]|nr:SDR family NAD(P)-dependent oxidoreductase [Fusobacteriota bacterium]